MLTFSSDHNWMYCSLSGKGTIRKQFLCVEWFHRGCVLFRKQLEEVAFSSKDAFGETNEGGSGEDGVDMEDVSGEYGLNTEGGGREGGFDTEGEVAFIFYKYRMTSERMCPRMSNQKISNPSMSI